MTIIEIVALGLAFAFVVFVGWATFKGMKWIVVKVDNFMNRFVKPQVKPKMKRVK